MALRFSFPSVSSYSYYYDGSSYSFNEERSVSPRSMRRGLGPRKVYVDRIKTATEHVFKVDVPGVRREDMAVRVEGGRKLIISWERKKFYAQERHRGQITVGRFQKQLRLPDNSNVNAVTANLDNGVLTIVVMKIQNYEVEAVRNIDISEAVPPRSAPAVASSSR